MPWGTGMVSDPFQMPLQTPDLRVIQVGLQFPGQVFLEGQDVLAVLVHQLAHPLGIGPQNGVDGFALRGIQSQHAPKGALQHLARPGIRRRGRWGRAQMATQKKPSGQPQNKKQ